METNLKPLSGINVVELATFVAAPTCCRVLADWGANVIKVEAPNGDPMRMMGALVDMPIDEDENVAYDQQNSNKKGIVINLKSHKGIEILHKLLSKADIFLTNNRQDALERMGLSYEQLREKYPRIVYGHILGYGEKGPDKDKPGFDFTAYYARGGISGSLYEKGTSPLMTVAGLGDHQAGMYLAAGVCAALFNAKMTGKGEKVSTSLLHTAIFGMGHMIVSAQYGGNKYPRSRKQTSNPLQAAYETKDGRWIQIAISAYDKEFSRFCQMLGLNHLTSDEKYSKFENVKDNPEEIITIFDHAFKDKTIDEWVKLFNKADLPCDKEMLWEEILEDEQSWADNILSKVSGYREGKDRILVNSPVKFKNMGLPEVNKAPKLGENTVEILSECGYTTNEIDEFLNSKIVK